MKNIDKVSEGVRQVPSGIRDRILEIGDTFDETLVDAMQELYVPLLEARDRKGISIIKDISYGAYEGNELDIHVPTRSSADLASVVFFHGGGFVQGHKNLFGESIYGNVANYFVRHGMIGVNATYRLAPHHQWPSGADDVGVALRWLRDNISEFGGNPDKIVIMGQSAGATHVATYAFRSDIHGPDGPGCAGVILMSGIYNAVEGQPSPNHLAYFGDDPDSHEVKMVLGNMDWAGCPVFISIAEFDPPRFQQSGIGLMNVLASGYGNMPRLKMLLGHNHISQVMHIDTPDDTLGAEAIDFIRTCVEV